MKRLVSITLWLSPLLLALAIVGAGLAWLLPPVRLLAFTLAASQELVDAEAALKDPSDHVVSSACIKLLEAPDQAVSERAIKRLAQRPKAALKCLTLMAERDPNYHEFSAESAAPAESAEVIEDEDKAGEAPSDSAPDEAEAERAEAAKETDIDTKSEGDEPPQKAASPGPSAPSSTDELVPAYQVLASNLGQRWAQQLTSQKDVDCAIAEGARHALSTAQMDPTHHLLSCSLIADGADTRACCVQELGGEASWAELLDTPSSHPLGNSAAYYSSYIAATFPQDAKTEDSESSQDSSEDKESAPRFGEHHIAAQDWSVGVGCELRRVAPSDVATISAFSALLESEGCAPTDSPWAGYFDTMSWDALCHEHYDFRRQELQEAPAEAICRSLEVATVGQIIQVAQNRVVAATSTAGRVPGARPDISSGIVEDIQQRRISRVNRSRIDQRQQRGRVLNAFFQSVIAP